MRPTWWNVDDDKRLVMRVDVMMVMRFCLASACALPNGTAEGPGGHRLEVQNPSSSSAPSTEVKRSFFITSVL